MEQFNFKNYYVKAFGNVLPSELARFIEVNHYKKSAKSLKQRFVFGLYHEELLVGVAVYGEPCGAKVAQTYGCSKTVLELRRFCLLPEAPKNSESFFLSKTLKLMKQSHIKRVISFADANMGHEGIIYKASNWEYLGAEKYRQQYLKLYNGRLVSMREVYQKKNGKYNPAALNYQALKAAGKAKAVMMKPKHIYSYQIRE